MQKIPHGGNRMTIYLNIYFLLCMLKRKITSLYKHYCCIPNFKIFGIPKRISVTLNTIGYHLRSSNHETISFFLLSLPGFSQLWISLFFCAGAFDCYLSGHSNVLPYQYRICLPHIAVRNVARRRMGVLFQLTGVCPSSAYCNPAVFV